MSLDTYFPKTSFGQISGLYPRPHTKRILVNGPADYKIIEVRPDFSVIMKDATLKSQKSRIGFTFLEGEKPSLFDYKTVTQSLYENYIPIVLSEARTGNVLYKQTVFTLQSISKKFIYMNLEITNLHSKDIYNPVLWFSVIQKNHADLYDIYNEDYLPYHAKTEPWLDGVSLVHDGNFLLQDRNTVLGYQMSQGVLLEYVRKDNDIKNALKFTFSLIPGESKSIRIVIPYEGLSYIEPDGGQQAALTARKKYILTADKKHELLKTPFCEALQKSASRWESVFEKGAQIIVPEPAVNKVWNTLKLNCLQMIAHPLESNCYIAGQGGFNDYSLVYGWESSFLLTALDTIGYHKEVEKVLDYYLSIQGKNKGPDGEIHSTEGTFCPSVRWMCETGAILKIFGHHYLYTRDERWLIKVSSSILKAFDWIRDERKSTKIYNSDGSKAAYFGLLPKGKPHDWPNNGYFFFSDCNTYAGLKAITDAYVAAGLPEADILSKETEDYRKCIQEAFTRSIMPFNKDSSDIFAPNEVGGKKDHLMTSYGIDGPVTLLDNAIIDSNDTLVPQIEMSLRRLGIINDLFAGKLCKMEDERLENLLLKETGGKYDLYYVTNGEKVWHKVFLDRGEKDKALRYFYSTIAYATTSDIGYCSERFCPQLPWLLPWQPNASGNGRIIDMIQKNLFYEKDNSLIVMAGVPAAWLEPGMQIIAKNCSTQSAKISLHICSTSVGKSNCGLKIVMKLFFQKQLKKIILRNPLPYPTCDLNVRIKSECNMKEIKAEISDNDIILPAVTGRITIYIK